MIRKTILLFATLITTCLSLSAQELYQAQGKVEIIQDKKVEQLAEQYRKMSINNPNSEGFRVQIFFDSGSNSKYRAASVKADFETSYPGIKSYLSYKEPYYRVRVGNFRTIIEAVGFQKEIETNYPNCFPVKDEIVQ